MKGNGMPVTGSRPMAIPTFTRTWKKIIEAMPHPDEHRERVVRAPGTDEHSPYEAPKQDQHDDGPNEPEFLGQQSPHEVGLRHWQYHLAVGESCASYAAGPYGGH